MRYDRALGLAAPWTNLLRERNGKRNAGKGQRDKRGYKFPSAAHQ
jgi:hypothetical protein